MGRWGCNWLFLVSDFFDWDGMGESMVPGWQLKIGNRRVFGGLSCIMAGDAR